MSCRLNGSDRCVWILAKFCFLPPSGCQWQHECLATAISGNAKHRANQQKMQEKKVFSLISLSSVNLWWNHKNNNKNAITTWLTHMDSQLALSCAARSTYKYASRLNVSVAWHSPAAFCFPLVVNRKKKREKKERGTCHIASIHNFTQSDVNVILHIVSLAWNPPCVHFRRVEVH